MPIDPLDRSTWHTHERSGDVTPKDRTPVQKRQAPRQPAKRTVDGHRKPTHQWAIVLSLCSMILLVFFILYTGFSALKPQSLSLDLPKQSITSQPQAPVPSIKTTLTLSSGAADWMVLCSQQSWGNYTSNPTYVNASGKTVGKNLYPNGNFWLLAGTGKMQVPDPSEQQCLNNAIKAVHNQAHPGKVCGVLGAQMQIFTARWTARDITHYEQRVIQDVHHAELQYIIQNVKQFGYDCLISDIEGGTDDGIYTSYIKLLRDALHKMNPPIPLGITLMSKFNTPLVLKCRQTWQNDQNLSNAADFFVVMAIDQPDDYSYDNNCNFNPHGGPLFTNGWLTQLYAYYNSVGIMNHPVEWELPSYAGSSWSPSDDQYAGLLDSAARTLVQLNHGNCIALNFWSWTDAVHPLNDPPTANSRGWWYVQNDTAVKIC
jgi:hypothetical protein